MNKETLKTQIARDFKLNVYDRFPKVAGILKRIYTKLYLKNGGELDKREKTLLHELGYFY